MAAVLGAFVPDTSARWRSLSKGDVARELDVAREAREMAGRLNQVSVAVDNAEKLAARGDKDAAEWLATVRARTYEANDAVDTFRDAGRQHRETRQQHRQALPRLLSSCCHADDDPRRHIAAELNKVNKKLKAVGEEQDRLKLYEFSDHMLEFLESLDDDDSTVHTRTVLRRRNHHATGGDIVDKRFDNDKRQLVDRLTQKPTHGQAACEIVEIIGADGIGKTTLAKAVYESTRVRCCFEIRSWIRLCRGYTEASLLSQVIDAVGGNTAGDESVAKLEAMLAILVADKRFLLVVDDVWYGGAWDAVLRPRLERGGRGSKVLITAQSGTVLRGMGVSHLHRVHRLSADDGWLLLCAAACVASDESDAGQLRGTGERLVEKCGGMPLAIEAIAGVLRTRKVTVDEWEEVLRSPAWLLEGLPDKAMTPLYVCYDDLPPHLKQCFLYCSLFPLGFAVDRKALVQQWIAERFLQARVDATIEEVAEEYYDELVGRNLLQTTEKDSRERCTMHEMLHALALLLSRGESFTGGARLLLDDNGASLAARRVSLPGRNMAAIPYWVLSSDRIRTLLLPRNPLATAGEIFERMHQLRVLDLSETGIELVPETLGNLVRLRFLNLSRTRIQAVPESIGNLRSLKFLLLRECKSLRALPKSIEHLTELRDLDLAGTVIDAVAFRVRQLTNLTSLRHFAVTSAEACPARDRVEWPLAELKLLLKLRTLHVQKLEKADSPAAAAEAALAAKTRLRELALSCSDNDNLLQTPQAVKKIEGVFQELNPPELLESLKIANYFGATFPTWLSATLLPNLRRLDIIRCNAPLPPLGQLPELRSLHIADSSALKVIDAQFMGTCNHHQVPFPKLEDLHLQGLHKLQTWVEIEAGWFPSLQAMQLENCPRLQRLPGGLRHVTSLLELRIVDMKSLEAVENIAALRELSVWNTPNLKKISNMPSLEDLSISHCQMLQTVTNVDRLQAVHIFDHQLQKIPRWIKPLAAKLRSLNVRSTIELLERCLVDGPDWPLIKDIVRVYGLAVGSGYVYYTKSPYIFESNVNAQRNLDTEGKTADSDDAPAENTNANQDVLASPSDSKAIKKEAIRTEDNVTHRSTERSVQKNSRRRMHKLAEVSPEDSEAEEDAVTSVLNRQRPNAAEGIYVNKSAAAVGHNLVGEGSRAINSTEIDQDLNVSILRSNLCTLNKGDNFSNISKQSRRVHDNGSNVQTQVVSSDTKELGDDRTENGSPAIKARRKSVTFKFGQDEHADATVNQKKDDKIHKIVTSATASTNATAMPEIPPDGGVAKKSAGATNSNLIVEGHHTESTSKASPDLGLLHGEQRISSEGKEVPNAAKDPTCTAVDNTGGHTEGKSISLPANPKTNHDESKGTSFTETRCGSKPRRLPPRSVDWRKLWAREKQEASSAGPSNGIGASIKKIPDMPSRPSDQYKAEPREHPSTQASKNTDPQLSATFNPFRVTGTTEAPKEADASVGNGCLANRHIDDNTHGSIDVKADDTHQAPKVWADTDTDTLRARHEIAPRCRHCHGKEHGSGNTWSIGQVLAVVQLVFSMAQLLLTFLLCHRLLNQK